MLSTFDGKFFIDEQVNPLMRSLQKEAIPKRGDCKERN